MADNDRLDGFAPPGIISVSAAALQMARDFADVLKREKPNEDWIACFDWADTRGMRFPRPGGPMQELGPDCDLAGYERRRVPDDALHSVEGGAFAIKIPSRVWLNSAERLIDADPNASSGLTLR
jgi:hypothetical protein